MRQMLQQTSLLRGFQPNVQPNHIVLEKDVGSTDSRCPSPLRAINSYLLPQHPHLLPQHPHPCERHPALLCPHPPLLTNGVESIVTTLQRPSIIVVTLSPLTLETATTAAYTGLPQPPSPAVPSVLRPENPVSQIPRDKEEFS